jgi:spoIIIJ-associated protein
LDAEDYRNRRNETLIQLANRVAQKALKTGKDVSLEPMPSYERKVIHTALAENNRVKTSSDGTEPHRYVVITPSKK